MVSAALERLAKQDGLDRRRVKGLIDFVSLYDEHLDGLGFCLSEEDDQLSQWRGYADDGFGVAIGYSKQYLEALIADTQIGGSKPIILGKVEYGKDGHNRMVEPAYIEAKEAIDQGALDYPKRRGLLESRTPEEIAADDKHAKQQVLGMALSVMSLFPKLFLLKSRAFREGQEWRLVSHRSRSGKDECKFRSARDRIVPYVEIKLPDLEMPIINSVTLGPKHITPVSVVKDFVRQLGYGDVSVVKSLASYR